LHRHGALIRETSYFLHHNGSNLVKLKKHGWVRRHQNHVAKDLTNMSVYRYNIIEVKNCESKKNSYTTWYDSVQVGKNQRRTAYNYKRYLQRKDEDRKVYRRNALQALKAA
jgi:hypothetical protein